MPKKLEKLQLLGSKTAKWWFQNERDVIEIFNSWESNSLSQNWLIKMWYDLKQIEYVLAVKVAWSFKSDIQVQIQVSVKLKWEIDCQNISVKLVSNPTWYNQIDKRWVKNYIELWGIDDKMVELLKRFTWEIRPNRKGTRDRRRMFIDEFLEDEQNLIIDFFKKNRLLIISDILKWRWKFSAEWMLVILKNWGQSHWWALEPMNYVMNFYDWEIKITKKWSLNIWKITMQRKWWDNWEETANMLQFKFNPALLINNVWKQ